MAATIEKVQSEQTKASTGFRAMPLEPHRRSMSDGVVIVSRHGETATTPGSTGSDPGTPGSRQRAIRKRLASMTGLHHVFSKPKAFPSPGVQCLWPVLSRLTACSTILCSPDDRERACFQWRRQIQYQPTDIGRRRRPRGNLPDTHPSTNDHHDLGATPDF